jgi:hypothetical protein
MDLTTMMRDQAKAGLQTQLDAAVADGNAEQARKITDQIAALAVQTAPKAAPYTNQDVWKAAEAKAPWLGVDPKKSATANEFAKTMNPAKFATAEAMADAVIKAVEEEYKTTTTVVKEPLENETDEEREAREAEEAEAAAAEAEAEKKRTRRTNGPEPMGAGTNRRASAGPWTKLGDAPADVQKEIKRTADRFVPANAPKEQRERYIATALGSHYAAHQRKAGKK